MTKVQVVGNGVYGSTETQVDPTHRAIRTSVRPSEVGAFGSYRLALNTGAMAAGLAAGSPIFAVRWATSGAAMLLKRLTLMAYSGGTGFTAGQVLFNVYRAQSFSVLDTGSAAITFNGKDNARASRYAGSALQSLGGIAIANTGTLTAGTRTLDHNPFSSYSMQIGVATQAKMIDETTVLYDARAESNQPEEFWNNEGFVIQATVPATGVWGPASVTMEWDEVDPARYYGSFG